MKLLANKHIAPLTTALVLLSVSGGALHADVEMPEGLPGTFVWKGKVTQLHPGSNELQFK